MLIWIMILIIAAVIIFAIYLDCKLEYQKIMLDNEEHELNVKIEKLIKNITYKNKLK